MKLRDLASQYNPAFKFLQELEVLSRKRPQNNFDQQVRSQSCFCVVSSSPVMPRSVLQSLSKWKNSCDKPKTQNRKSSGGAFKIFKDFIYTYRNEQSIHWVVKVRVPDAGVANQFGIPANTSTTVIDHFRTKSYVYCKSPFPFLEDQIKPHWFCRW